MHRRTAAVVTAALVWIPAVGALAASPGTNPFTHAISYFNPDSAEAITYEVPDGVTVGPGFVPAFQWYQFCWPPTSGEMVPDVTGEFTVSPTGMLDGSCVANTAGSSARRQSTLTGTYDLAAQTVQFVFQGTQIGITNPHVATMSLDSPVTPVVGDRAEGEAEFTYTCTPGEDADAPCAFYEIQGTVMFAIQFQPYLATPDPNATGVPSGAPGALSVVLTCSADVRYVNCAATPSGAGDGADLTYAWTFNGSPQVGTGASFQYDFIEAELDNGSYPVSVTVTDNADGRTASNSASVELGTFGSVADSNPNTLILLLVLAGAGVAIIGAFLLWLRGRTPKPDFVRADEPIEPPVKDDRTFAVGADRSGGFEDSLEYGDGAGVATPGASKAYEALVVASSSQATASEPLAQPEGEKADLSQAEQDDIDDALRREDPGREGR